MAQPNSRCNSSDAKEVSGESGRACDACLNPHHYFMDNCAEENAMDYVKRLLTYMELNGAAEGKETKIALCPKCDVLTQTFAQIFHVLRMCVETLDRSLQIFEGIREIVLDCRRGIRGDVFEEGSTPTVVGGEHVSLDTGLEGTPPVVNAEVLNNDQVPEGFVYAPISEDEDVHLGSCVPDGGKNADEVIGLERNEHTFTKEYVFPFRVEKLANGQEKLLYFCCWCNDTVYDPDNHRQPHDTTPGTLGFSKDRPGPAALMTQATPSPSSFNASLSCAMPIPDKEKFEDMFSPAQGCNNDRRTSCGLCSKTFSIEYTCTIHRACRHAPEFFRGYKKQSTSVDQFRSIVDSLIKHMRKKAADRARAEDVALPPGRDTLRCEFCTYRTRNSSQWKCHTVYIHNREVGAWLEQLQENLPAME